MKHVVVIAACLVVPLVLGFFLGVVVDVGQLFGIGHGRHELERLLHMGVGTLLGLVVGVGAVAAYAIFLLVQR